MSVLRPRRTLSAVDLYARPRDARINLSDNTNRWGSAPSAAAALRNANDVVAYPEPYAEALKNAAARYLGVKPEQITTGCGSDAVLDAALRAFGEPGDRVAIPEPTFPMSAVFASANALEPVLLPLGADYQPDAGSIIATGARIVYLCSPNNPLGTPCSVAVVETIARTTEALVIVDEAYAEFTGTTFVPLVDAYPNLIVVRTMSKAFGLAGLRVGYAVGNAHVVREIDRSRGPYQVGALGVAAATAALDGDREWVQRLAAIVAEQRDRLTRALRARGLAPVPSVANFVLCPMPDAAQIAARMHERGVAVRAYESLRAVSPALAATGGSAIRMTLAPPDELDAALDAFDAAREVVACA